MIKRPTKQTIVKEEENIVIAVWKSEEGIFKGIAKCLPTDTFNDDFGKKAANLRAEMKYVIKQTKLLNKAYEDQIKLFTKAMNDASKISSMNNAFMDRYFEIKEELEKLGLER